MTTRHQLYRQFGPRMIEAMARVLFGEINRLRARAGLPEYTVQQAVDALQDEYSNITPYDWEDQDT